MYKPDVRTEGYQVADLLSAAYNSIKTEILTFDYFTVTDSEAGLPDLIAKNFYDDENLWWVICLYNGIIDPLVDLTTGMRIKIPTLQATELFLTRKLSPSSNTQRKNTFTTI